MPIRAIPAPADPGAPPLSPPCSGNWLRQADGSLLPADESTARAAGLFDEPAAAPSPSLPGAPGAEA